MEALSNESAPQGCSQLCASRCATLLFVLPQAMAASEPTCLCGKLILWVGCVLQAVAAHHAGALVEELEAAIAHSKEVIVLRIPAEGGDVLAFAALCLEAPQWQQGALPLSELVRDVIPVLQAARSSIALLVSSSTVHVAIGQWQHSALQAGSQQ